jgi:hypothetical protein
MWTTLQSMIVSSVLTVLAAGCAPRALAIGADHPANPDAPPGRLAGPPPALRVGVAEPAMTDAPAHVHPVPDPAAPASSAPTKASAEPHPSSTSEPSRSNPRAQAAEAAMPKRRFAEAA